MRVNQHGGWREPAGCFRLVDQLLPEAAQSRGLAFARLGHQQRVAPEELWKAAWNESRSVPLSDFVTSCPILPRLSFDDGCVILKSASEWQILFHP